MAVEPDTPQVLVGSLTEQEAAALAGHLESLGIEAHIWGANSTAAWPEVPRDVQVAVRQADLALARDALDRLPRQGPQKGSDPLWLRGV
jgi:hypothetical protein